MNHRQWSMLARYLGTGLYYSSTTSLIVYVGLLASPHLRASGAGGHQFDSGREAFTNWDGQWYKDVAKSGYRYDPRSRSNVAFFPAYPLVGRAVARLFRISFDWALLITSNVFLLLWFCLMVRYVEVRYASKQQNISEYVIMAMGTLPPTFFFRVAYSESMFLALAILSLYAIARRWPLLVVAAIIGLGTAVRPVGIALLPPLVVDTWRRSPKASTFLLRACYVVPLGCWGLAGYMIYLQAVFGDPLAFAQAQANWRLRLSSGLGGRLLSLATLEPVWSAYIPSSRAYWERFADTNEFLFSLPHRRSTFFHRGRHLDRHRCNQAVVVRL